MISCAVIVMLTAWQNSVTLNSPSGVRNFMRLSDARLHALSSRNMYSLHGFDALIGAVFGQVCQLLTVVWNCIPGSPQTHAASAICLIRSRALYMSTGRPFRIAFVVQVLSSTSARMNSSVVRTEWLAF